MSSEVSSPRPRRRLPAWLWFVFILLALGAFWTTIPLYGTEVPFSPWFLEQVAEGNVQSLLIRGTRARGELIEPRDYWGGRPGDEAVRVTKYVVEFPSAASIQPVVEELTREGRPGGRAYIRAEPDPSACASWLGAVVVIASLVALSMLLSRRRGGGKPEGGPGGEATPATP